MQSFLKIRGGTCICHFARNYVIQNFRTFTVDSGLFVTIEYVGKQRKQAEL